MRSFKKIIFLAIVFIVTVAFNFQDNPASNWTQQFLPPLGNQQINDMTFIDSLTGFIVTSINSNPDAATILKTTNGGDNWNTVFSQTPARFGRVQFVTDSIGFVSGKGGPSGFPVLYKTTNKGNSWILIDFDLGNIYWDGMWALNKDTIWLSDKNSFNGGIYRTTNGGLNWTQQLSAGIYNPTHIYFYNKSLGFAANSLGGKLYRTTNAGVNWIQVLNEGFRDMKFVDELTGWKSLPASDSSMKKTTDGGLNWVKQKVPYGGFPNVLSDGMLRFSVINKDTLWGVGGNIYFSAINKGRGILYHTTNGGTNWTYQIPDTSINIAAYYHINSINKNNIWAYTFSPNMGIHTTNGGDTTFISSIRQLSNEIPNSFKLNQNYPNPFNPSTKINYDIKNTNYVSLKIFDINGREISTLVNQKQTGGTYEYTFDGSLLSSGIYFYTLQTDKFTDTKKMMLVK